MKIIAHRYAILLAAALQLLPVVRNIFTSPAASSTFAIILRWGMGATATVGTVDAVSGATTAYFTSATSFTGTVGVPFTNNLTLANTQLGGGSEALITNTTNSISVLLAVVGQSTNFAMPPGLILQFLEDVNQPSPIYDAIYGLPTVPGTNSFIISMLYKSVLVSTNITITILPGVNVAPVITNQPKGLTGQAGSPASFNVVAGGSTALSYQWFFNTNTLLADATNSLFSISHLRLSLAGKYSVIITNIAGSVTSSAALLTVTKPPAPPITSSVLIRGTNEGFQFTFNPVTGLTNTVLASANLFSQAWETLTNFAPPTTSNSITVADVMTASNRFYRIEVVP